MGNPIPVLTGPLLPEDPASGSPGNSDPVDSPVDFVSFYANTAQAADLAFALAQKAIVGSPLPQDSLAHRDGC